MTTPTEAQAPPPRPRRRRRPRWWWVLALIIGVLALALIVWFLVIPRLFPQYGQDGLVGAAQQIAAEVDGREFAVHEAGEVSRAQVIFEVTGPRGPDFGVRMDELDAVLERHGWMELPFPDWTDTEFHTHRWRLVDGRPAYVLVSSPFFPRDPEDIPDEAVAYVQFSFERF